MKTAKIRAITSSLLVFLLLSGSGCRRLVSKVFLPDEVRNFAEEYIYLLNGNEIEKARNLLHEEVREEITEEDIKRVIKYIGNGEILELKSLPLSVKKTDYGAGYVLSVVVKYKKSSRSILMAVSDIDGDMRVASLMALKEGSPPMVLSEGAEDIRGKLYGILKVNPEEMPELPSLTTTCAILLLILIMLFIQIAGMWQVFIKAGEPGWAVLVPVYNAYVLARIGGKPEWMGVVACLAGFFIPFAGPIIGWVLFIMISIGVARNFGKGVLFGLGLCFLSFIFYPILGFGSAETTVGEPAEKDYAARAASAGRQFYAPADVTTSELPPIPMPEEPEIPKVPQFKADAGPAGGIHLGEEFIHFHCSCGKGFKVPKKLAGKMGTCPQCKKRIKIPGK
jgi:hypothetical protein